MAKYNEKIVGDFITQDALLSHIVDKDSVNLKTIYYTFIDGDTVMEKEYLEFSKKYFKKNKEVQK